MRKKTGKIGSLMTVWDRYTSFSGTQHGKFYNNPSDVPVPLKEVPVVIPEQSAHLLSDNPCVRVFGAGPKGKTCHTCAHKQYRRVTAKNGVGLHDVVWCEPQRETHMPNPGLRGTAACGKYEEAGKE